VAAVALDRCMRASQREFRRLAVIEVNRGPLDLIVAAFALGAVSSGMDVLNPVAIHACGTDVLVAFADMARGAEDGAMSTLKTELRLVVVERLEAPPRRLAMAIVAGLPKTPLVRIVCLVTIEAPSGRVAELDLPRVTVAARYRPVGVPQLEIRESMIEGLAVELDDVGLSSHMVGMTMGAFLFLRIRLPPMESPARRLVRRDVFVARKAKPRLRLPRKRLVTAAALLLELGVPGHQRSGHDQVLEQILRPRDRRHSAGHDNPHHDRERACEWPAQQRASHQKKCAA